MKAAAFELAQPRSIGEALQILAQANGAGRVLAGGQSLVPMMNLRLAQPSLLVDMGRIAELSAIDKNADGVTIGSMVTHAAIEDGKVPDNAATAMLRHVAGRIAYRGIRNRGTIGGSLSHADPAADWPAALLALDAVVQTASPRGERRLAVADFLIGAFTTALANDEIITAIVIPDRSAKTKWAYNKLCRKIGEFAHSIAAVVHDTEKDYCRVVVGAVGGAPRRIENMAEKLAARRTAAPSIDRAAAQAELALLGLPFDAIDLHVHATLLSRTVQRAYVQ